MLHFVRSNIKRVLVQGINTVLMLTLSFSSFIYVLTPRVALADTTFSLYAQTSKNTYSNFNDTSVNQTYAWQWTPTTSGVPTQLTLSIDHVTGTPTGSVCIRADKTAASASFGCASNVTFTAGDNVLTIANGVALTAGTSYWAYFTRTSDASNYPSIQYKYPTAGAAMYRSLADNTDPTGLWFNYDIAMSITGAASTAAAASAPVTLYSQTTGGTYSYFAYRGADERFAWQWKPVVSGTPTQLTLFTELVQGTPTGSVCIRADRKIASQSFGCANNVTFKAGQNDLTLTGAAPVIAGTTYWIYYVRTSGGTWQDNFAAFQYKYPTAGTFTAYRSSTLGADPSDADYWFTYDMKMVVTGMSDAASTPVTPPAPAPVAPTSQPIISTLTLYDQAQRGTYSNFNWNGAGDNYAWKWAPISNGIPNRIHLWTDHVTGTPTGDICIRATQSTASASYGCATNVTLKAGENIIPLTGGQAVSWEGGNTYFVHFTRTSDANNYPSFQYRYPQTNYPLYRSSVAGGEPTTLWFNYDIAMSIENVQYAPAPSTVTLAPLVIYSQDTHNTYSNFNDNSSGEEYAWQWEPQADGIPSQLLISLERTMGNPSGSFCIREHKERNSASFGCTGPVTFTAGQNIFPLTGTAPVYKTGVYYVHFNRTSSALDYPSIQYQTVGGKYAVYRSTTATGDPDNNWFTADIAMTIRGTNLTTPAPVSNLIYGLSPDQALALYNKLGSVDRTVTTGGTAIELGIIDNAASLAGAGRSTVIAPTISAIQAKEFPQYYYPYRYLIPEYSKSVIVGDTPINSYVEYDQLGAALGKAPTMPVAPAPVDKTGYIYGMPRAEADAIYQLLKTGTIIRPGYIDAGDAGQISSDILWEISTYRIASGLYRVKYTTTGDCVTASSNQSAYWTHAYAEAHCYRDYSLDQMKASYAKPYHFLAPGFIAALSSTSVTSGVSKAIAFSSAEIPYVIYFTTLESALGYPPSGAMTPDLTYEAPPVDGLVPLTYKQVEQIITTATLPAPTISVNTHVPDPVLPNVKPASKAALVMSLPALTTVDSYIKSLPQSQANTSCDGLLTEDQVKAMGRKFADSARIKNAPKIVTFIPDTLTGIVTGIAAKFYGTTRGLCYLVVGQTDIGAQFSKALMNSLQNDIEYLQAVAQGREPNVQMSELDQLILNKFNEFAEVTMGDDYFEKGYISGTLGFDGGSAIAGVEGLNALLADVSILSIQSSRLAVDWLSQKITFFAGNLEKISLELIRHGVPADLALAGGNELAAAGDINQVRQGIYRIAESVEAGAGATVGSELSLTDAPVLFRGGSSMVPKLNEIKFAPDGKIIRGISLNTDPIKMVNNYGSAYKITELPEGLAVRQIGKPDHYIVVSTRPMSFEEYSSLVVDYVSKTPF